MSSKKQTPRVVTLGGGTGTYSVITALKQLQAEISSIVAVSDSGGSTGRIRDEFGFQPVGDLRQSLAAMADPKEQEWIKKILLYRFSQGEGLKGHNLGNLILTALQDMAGSTTEALQIAERVFGLQGQVIPVTTKTVDLKIHYADGTTALGEHILDISHSDPKEVEKVELVPECSLNPSAKKAIQVADFCIIGPGDYYASLMATLVVPGLEKALRESSARIIYVVNLMSRRTQTHQMSAQDHVVGIEKVIGTKLDVILINDAPLPAPALERYAQQDEYPIHDDLGDDSRVVRAHLLNEDIIEQSTHDTAHRSLLRHDGEALARVLQTILSDALG